MLTNQGCRSRRDRLFRGWGDQASVDAVIITDPAHVTYLSGYSASPYEFRSVRANAWLLIRADGHATLIADNLLDPYSKRAHVDEVVAPVWYQGKASAPVRDKNLLDATLEVLGGSAAKRVGVEATSAPFGLARSAFDRGIEVEDIGDALFQQRRVKDRDEVELFERSVRAAEAGHALALAELRPKMTELDLFRMVRDRALEVLGEPAHVYGDFVSGPRCEDIGEFASQRVIEAGDLILLDFSVVVSGYRCDFANTFVCQGEPRGEVREAFEACMRAMRVGEELARAGVPCRDIDEAIRADFGSKREHFLTHSGHGLGLAHPEPPFLVPNSQDVLEAGNIITIEPGQYVKGSHGMRFERNYLVKERGLEVLSHHDLRLTQG